MQKLSEKKMEKTQDWRKDLWSIDGFDAKSVWHSTACRRPVRRLNQKTPKKKALQPAEEKFEQGPAPITFLESPAAILPSDQEVVQIESSCKHSSDTTRSGACKKAIVQKSAKESASLQKAKCSKKSQGMLEEEPFLWVC